MNCLQPVEEWPLCDVLLSWHSDGFPLAKGQAYARLRTPYCVNDLDMQAGRQRCGVPCSVFSLTSA